MAMENFPFRSMIFLWNACIHNGFPSSHPFTRDFSHCQVWLARVPALLSLLKPGLLPPLRQHMNPNKPLMKSKLHSSAETRDLAVKNTFSDLSLKNDAKELRCAVPALPKQTVACSHSKHSSMWENHFTEFLTKKQWPVRWAPLESPVGLEFQ